MTTKVLIANFGPDHVVVRTVNPDDARPDNTLPDVNLEKLLPAGSSHEVDVRRGVQVVIGERRNKPADDEG
jgi:hypothetical protein